MKYKEDTILNQINNNAYNDLILIQDDTVYFHNVELLFNEELHNEIILRAWERLNKKFQPITETYNTQLYKNFSRRQIDGVTRDPEEWRI